MATTRSPSRRRPVSRSLVRWILVPFALGVDGNASTPTTRIGDLVDREPFATAGDHVGFVERADHERDRACAAGSVDGHDLRRFDAVDAR